MLALGGNSCAYRQCSENHHNRSGHHQQPVRSIGMRQFAKHQRAPRQSPELIRIRQRNAAPDAQILRRVLLKNVADHPHKSAQKKPEQHGPRLRREETMASVDVRSSANASASTAPSSPTVNTVTNDSGFMPLR